MKNDDIENPRVAVFDKLPIELYIVLKNEKVVQSGGEAKYVIAEGLVTVNGNVETRKRKKINSGDIITFAGESIKIAANE